MAKITKKSAEWYKLVFKIVLRYAIPLITILFISIIMLVGCKSTKTAIKTDIVEKIDSTNTENISVIEKISTSDSTKIETDIDEDTETIKIELADGEVVNLNDLINKSSESNFNAKSVEFITTKKKVSQNQQNAVKNELESETAVKDSTTLKKDTKEQTKTKEESKKNTQKFGLGFLVCLVVLFVLCFFLPVNK